jgi:hypothetical protein
MQPKTAQLLDSCDWGLDTYEDVKVGERAKLEKVGGKGTVWQVGADCVNNAWGAEARMGL